MDDEHRNGAVVQDVVADAAEKCGSNGTAAAGAHHDEIVVALSDPTDQCGSDRLLAQHRANGDVVGDAFACVPKDRFSLRIRVFA
jgi:hypothetical protein